ncbi:uncharacterized protein LOC115038242 [Echeneis naucrates]|uniref:uncharacterized protein LOC115038242 n=1 Tax=Echeneis naucrates TaxID=173247 RepID=UPI001113A8EA|nr:uncharacterized protein LOC115038242 [Echeneis naucrates]
MAGTVHIDMAMILLLPLLSFTEYSPSSSSSVSAGYGYVITFPCEDTLACFHLWEIRTRRYIAIVTNGDILAAESEERKCFRQVKDLTVEDIGHHQCSERTNEFSTHSTAPVLNLLPAKTVSLQCVALTYLDKGLCRRVSLAWVDEDGVRIQEDAYHLIHRPSPCAITLTVTFQSPGNRTLRCQATVNEQIKTSAEFRLRAPALRGKGKGLTIDLEHNHQGGNLGKNWAAVGVVGCIVLTAVIAVIVVKRRRKNQLPNKDCSIQAGTISEIQIDDVIYADITFPAGSDRVLISEKESTEYACVRHI